MRDQLVAGQSDGTLNPVHSAVIQDLLDTVLPHMDDAEEGVRAAVARVVARIGRLAPSAVRETLRSARDRHRCSELCDQLLAMLQQMA